MAGCSFGGKRALVTGASRGVGRAIATGLAARGAIVFGTSRQPDDVEWADGVAPLLFDLSSPEAVEQSWKRADFDREPPDIVVNNAGGGVLGAFEEAAFDEWERQIQVLLLAPMTLCHLALNTWSPRRRGILANVSSLACEYPIPLMSGYNTGKGGLSAFTESLVQDVDPRVAQVIELRLGDFKTDFNVRMTRVGNSDRLQKVWSAMERHIAASPPPEIAAARLLKAIEGGERGVIRAGSVFQRVIASTWGKIVSPSAKRAANLAYYNLRSR